MKSFDKYEETKPLDTREEMVQDLKEVYKSPPEWGKGPARNHLRNCTDTFCYILFVLVLVAMIATAIWAGTASDKKGLAKLYDSSGNICGEGSAAEFPILFLQTFESPYRSVCVAACPSFDYNEIARIGIAQPSNDLTYEMDYKTFARKHAGFSYTTADDMTEAEAFGYNPGWVNGYFTEDQWKKYLLQTKVECLPNQQFKSCTSDYKTFFPYDSYSVLGKICAPLSPKTALMFTKVTSSLQGSNAHDLAYAKSLYWYIALIAFALSLVFLLLLMFCTTLFSWLLFIVLALSLMLLGLLIFVSYGFTGHLNDSNNPLRVKYLQYLLDHKALFIITGILLILTGLFVFYLMIKYRKYIHTAIPLIKYAIKSSLRNFLLNILSIVVLVIQIFVFFIELFIIWKLYATGPETTNHQNGQPYATYALTGWSIFCIILHVFGGFWLIVVLNNFNDFVCAAATINDYFWHDERGPIRDLNVFCHTLGHHVGSIAWSLFLLPALVIQIIVSPIDFLTTSDNPNAVQRLFRKIFCPCFWCYDRVVKRMTANYFPLTYLGCENFLPASGRYLYLTERYKERSDAIIIIGDFFSISSKLLIMVSCIAFTFLIYQSRTDYQQNINNIGLLFFAAALEAYIVGALLINLFATTYQAVFICYLVEYDISVNTEGRTELKYPPELKEVMEEMKHITNRSYKPLN